METRYDAGERVLLLRYTYNSICAMEERAGVPLDQITERAFGGTRLLFWGALIDKQPEISLAQAGEIIGAHVKGGGEMDDIAALCSEALEKSGFFRPSGA